MRNRLAVNPQQFRILADLTLVALTLIVVTGAAVRLTGSGLGCPNWPKCYGHALPPISTHALIEFGNRALSGLVGVLTVVTAVLAATRRPFRRDLLVLSLTLPLGVAAQAVLGGFTVREHLAPGFVMAHFCLSMVILIGAVALSWRARHETGRRPRSNNRLTVWSVRVLSPLAALTIVVGTAATAAGPHAGGSPGQRIHRLTFKGADTLTWVVQQHATVAAVFGVAVVAVWLLMRRRGEDEKAMERITILGVLVAAQGLIGSVQYELHLPTDMVWVHVALATLTWLVVLWAVAAAGRLVPRRASVAGSEPRLTAPDLEIVSRA
ncbi:MAG: COX15/CtaA family protein [Solirubrobacteraceae bacterium]